MHPSDIPVVAYTTDVSSFQTVETFQSCTTIPVRCTYPGYRTSASRSGFKKWDSLALKMATYTVSMLWHQMTFKPQPLPADISLRGQTALVTGASAGIGLATAQQLAARGVSRLILAVRDAARGEAARAAIVAAAAASEGRSSDSDCRIDVWEVDAESWESLAAFAARADAELSSSSSSSPHDHDRGGAGGGLDLAVLNAGTKRLGPPGSGSVETESPTGHEAHLQVNHLAPALLSLALLGPLRRAARRTGRPSRLSFAGDGAHAAAPTGEFEGRSVLPQLDSAGSGGGSGGGGGGGWARYCASKLLTVLWARALAGRVSSQDVVVNAYSPGLVATGLHAAGGDTGTAALAGYVGFTPEQGALCAVDAVVGHGESHGAYVSEQKVKQPSAFVMSAAGESAQDSVWKETLAVLGEECPDFPFTEEEAYTKFGLLNKSFDLAV
ncbi:NAD(P)-binding protein [Xylariaceae sp. FL0804]|nr:NAD(P)-binding protein [Xylariaceae sp. FL0804]